MAGSNVARVLKTERSPILVFLPSVGDVEQKPAMVAEIDAFHEGPASQSQPSSTGDSVASARVT
jgi:hypothetical protein